MKKELSTSIEIEGSPRQVWQALTGFAAYAEWNPFIVDARGACAWGSTLRLRMQPVGGRPATLTPTVREVVPERRLRWVGTFLSPYLLRADHTFTIERRRGGCRLLQEETFTGALVPLISRSLDARTLPAFVLMNQALKAVVEQARVPPAA